MYQQTIFQVTPDETLDLYIFDSGFCCVHNFCVLYKLTGEIQIQIQNHVNCTFLECNFLPEKLCVETWEIMYCKFFNLFFTREKFRV